MFLISNTTCFLPNLKKVLTLSLENDENLIFNLTFFHLHDFILTCSAFMFLPVMTSQTQSFVWRWTNRVGQLLQGLSVDGQQDVALPDPAAPLRRLAREQLLDPDHAAEVAGGRVQLAHEEAEAQAVGALGQGHLLGVFWRGRGGRFIHEELWPLSLSLSPPTGADSNYNITIQTFLWLFIDNTWWLFILN